MHQERTALLSRWRQQVRQLPVARNLDIPTLNDHIPLLVDELVVAFQTKSDQTIPEALSLGSSLAHGLQRVQDAFALGQRSPQYYTLFVIDAYGNYSSGAVVRVVREGSIASSTADTLPPGVPSASSTATETGSADILTQQAVLIRQGTITIPLTGNIQLNAEGNYSIIIPKKDVTPHLKSIIVTVSDPTDQRIVSTYLLKLNQAGDAYEAVIQAPQVVGSARFRLEVFDFNLALVRTIETSFMFVKPVVSTRVFPDELLKYAHLHILPIVPFFAGGIFLWWLIVSLLKRMWQK